MARIACAFLARYELALRARQNPQLWKRMLAVADLALGQGRLGAVTPAVEARGVRSGERIAQARAVCPDLEILPPHPELRSASEKEILTALGTLSPLLDCDGRGAFFLSLAGLTQIVSSEPRFAEQIRTVFAGMGLEATVAIADTPFIAWVAARRAPTTLCIPSGSQDKFLAQIPVAELGLSERALALLAMVGLKTAGALAALPPGMLSRRLGTEGQRIEQLCRGESLLAWPSAAKVPTVAEEVSLELDGATEGLEPLLFLVKSLVDRLLSALALTRRALAELTLHIRLDDRTTVQHRLFPSEPTLQASAVMDLVRLWLDSRPFSAPVMEIRLVASRVDVAAARQLELFRQKEQLEGTALERAVARLVAAFGAEAVVRPSLTNTYRPEARLHWAPFPLPSHEHQAELRFDEEPVRRGPPHLMMRLIDPPEPIRWTQGAMQRPGKVPLPVSLVDGPHRLSGEWWDKPFERTYAWLSSSTGDVFWVFRDAQDEQLYLQAVAD